MFTEKERTDFLNEQDLRRGRTLSEGLFFSDLLVLLCRLAKKHLVLPSLDLELSTGFARPDISICKMTEIDFQNEELFYKEPPFAVIEIVSAKKTREEILEKIRNIYFPAGVGSAWIVIPQMKSIQLLTRDGEEVFYRKTLKDPTTGIKINVERVFEDLV